MQVDSAESNWTTLWQISIQDGNLETQFSNANNRLDFTYFQCQLEVGAISELMTILAMGILKKPGAFDCTIWDQERLIEMHALIGSECIYQIEWQRFWSFNFSKNKSFLKMNKSQNMSCTVTNSKTVKTVKFSEQFLVTEYFFKLFSEVTHISY